MRGVNKAIIMGFVGNEPESKKVGNQTVTNFSIATNEPFTDSSGTKREVTTWHYIAIWGKLGEIAMKYLKTGSLIYVEGKIVNKTWEKDGKTHYSSQIRVEEMTLLSKKD